VLSKYIKITQMVRHFLWFYRRIWRGYSGYFNETFMICQGRENRNCSSDNAALITEFVRFSELFGRLNYFAVVRQVDFQYHDTSLNKPKQSEKS